MTKSFIQVLKLSLALSLFTACAFDKNDPSADRAKEREKDRERLMALYAPVEGRYVGTLEFFGRPTQMFVDAELGLIVENENAGIDGDGLPITRPILRGYFKRADDLTLGLLFRADYNTFSSPNSQNLNLTNPTPLGDKPASSIGSTDGTSSQQDVTSIRGKLEGDTIEAEVLTGAGPIGKLTLKLKDKSTETKSQGSQNDINAKVMKLYKRIEGTYEGAAKVAGTALNPILARVTLTAAMDKGKPLLKAYYERLDLYPVTDFNQELVVDYKPEAYPQQITLSGVPASGGSMPGPATSSSSGFNFGGLIYSALGVTKKDCSNNFVDEECQYYMEGDLVLTRNLSTKIKLVRIQTPYQPPNSVVLGTYKGQLQFANRPGPNIEVAIFDQELTGTDQQSNKPVRRPVLTAYVQRSDSANVGALYSVSYNDLMNPNSYNLVIFGATVGNDIVSIRGNLKNKVFSAEVLSVNGVLGKVNLKWVSASTSAPSNGVSNENNENLLKLLKQAEGTYTGTVDYHTTEVPPYTAKFVVKAITTGSGKPTLRARYTRSDDPSEELGLDLDVDYKTETYPQKIAMTTAGYALSPGGMAGGRTYFLNLDGYLYPMNPDFSKDCALAANSKLSDCRPVIRGTLYAPRGRTAEVSLVKTK